MAMIKKEGFVWKILITLVTVLGFLYIGIAWYYQDQFLYGTRIGIVNASWLTVEETQERLLDSVEGYTLTIETKDGQTTEIKGSDIDLTYDFGDSIQNIKDSQNELEWLPALLSAPKHYDVEIPVVYDHEKLNDYLTEVDFLNAANMTQPVDAELLYDEENGFLYTQSVEGNKINFSAFTEQLKEALLGGKSVLNLADAGCYVLPEVTEASAPIKDMVEKLNAVTDFEISYSFGETEEIITKDEMWKWYRLDENDNLVLNETSVKTYVAELAKKYDTVGAERDFTTHNGETVKVSDGPYGWKINQSKEYEELLALVKAGKSEKGRQPVYSKTGFGERGIDDIGNTYIEISIEEQKMFYFEDGELYLETDVVTGNGGRHTKRGVAYIHNKARNATLVGADYVSFVKYWMKVWNGIGIHDASWRSKYGGKIYLTNGSHGCINTPLDNVIKLYERVEIGTPVVIY